MEKTLREIIANNLKLHELKIVNIAAHDEQESKRRRNVRYSTTDELLSLLSQRIKAKALTDEQIRTSLLNQGFSTEVINNLGLVGLIKGQNAAQLQAVLKELGSK